jgi:hypothetical protein
MLRNRAFLFRGAFETSLLMRSEYLFHLSDSERKRYEFRDLGCIPITTDAGLVGVAFVGSVAGCRLQFHYETAIAVRAYLGAVIQQIAQETGLTDHPAALAYRWAAPERTLRAFAELVRHMTPRFSQRIPERVIADAVREYAMVQGGWAARVTSIAENQRRLR